MKIKSLPEFTPEKVVLKDSRQVVLRSVKNRDIPQCLAIRKSVYGKPFEKADWLWKYGPCCPYPHDVLVAEHNGQVVAIQALLAFPFEVREIKLPALSLLDLMVHPEWQGQGIFRFIIQRIERELLGLFPFIYTFPNQRSFYGFTQNFGWTPLLHPNLLMRLALPYRIDKNEQEEFLDKDRVGIIKEKEYINWRYSRPGFKYVKISNQAVLALMEYKGVKVKGGFAAEFPSGGSPYLLKKMESKISPAPLTFLVNPSSSLFGFLKRKGFLTCINFFRRFNLIVKMNPGYKNLFAELYHWDLSFGDFDGL
ncbi:MAG: GNAT family N-acetyltransferase [candidate division WOR-3 bacterium]|nr:GNAT family N-acetyltransferase [candidate division WOR-3 bacterium]